MAFLNRGLTIALHRRAARATSSRSHVPERRAASSTSCVTSTRRRSRCSTTSATFARHGPRGRGRGRVAVEHRLPRRPAHASPTASPPPKAGCTPRASSARSRRRSTATPRRATCVKAKDATFQGDDVREGLTAIVSVRLADPQFEGQTKAKLGNTEMRSLVERATNEHFGRWLEEHPNPAKAIVAQGVERGAGAHAPRSRRASSPGARPRSTASACPTSSPTARRATATTPSCSSSRATPPAVRRATRAIRRTQAILPLRGKILNVERASMDKVVANTEIQSLTAAIGGGIGADFDVAKVRYGKVIILADADVDGGHIRTLLITFFYRQMTPLVEAGRLYVAQPPLYSVEIGGEKKYVADDAARLRVDRASTRTASCSSPASRVSARWTRTSCARRAWIPRRATSCSSTSTRAPSADDDAVGADGRRRRSPPQLDPAQRQRRPLPRRVGESTRRSDGRARSPPTRGSNQLTLDAPRRR